MTTTAKIKIATKIKTYESPRTLSDQEIASVSGGSYGSIFPPVLPAWKPSALDGRDIFLNCVRSFSERSRLCSHRMMPALVAGIYVLKAQLETKDVHGKSGYGEHPVRLSSPASPGRRAAPNSPRRG